MSSTGGSASPNTTTVAVIGGGALGLTVAYRLQQRGFQVTVLEAGELPGGLAAGFALPPTGQTGVPVSAEATDEHSRVWLEKFYHHIFKSDTTIISLINEIGLGSALTWQRPLTVTLVDGQPYQLDSPLSLLRFKPMPIVDRLRMGLVLAYLRLLPSPSSLEGKTATRWLSRTMGAKGYGIVFKPLLTGKFGRVADEIAMPWFWARIHDRSSQLGYIRGGFQRLYNHLAQRIMDAGGSVRLGVHVHQMARNGNHWTVTSNQAGSLETIAEDFGLVVSTLPTRLTCKLVQGLPASYTARYDWGDAYSAHCQILSLDRPLTDSYWMNINDPGYPFMVLCEHTNFMPREDYGGRYLVYLGKYGPSNDPLFHMSAREAITSFIPHLARINPRFDASWIQEAWAFSAPFAQPIVSTEYKNHIPPFDTPLPGLFVGSMFQVYPHDRGQNYSIELGERLATHVAKRHAASSSEIGRQVDPPTLGDDRSQAIELAQTVPRTRSVMPPTSGYALPGESASVSAAPPVARVAGAPPLPSLQQGLGSRIVHAVIAKFLDPWLWLSLLAVAGLILISAASTVQALDRDEGAFATIAQAINHGRLPYRDLFDQQGPGVYFLFAFILRFVTTASPAHQVTVLRLSADVANILTALGIVILGKKLWRIEVGALAAGLWLVALTQYEGNYFMTEPYMTVFSVWSIVSLVGTLPTLARKMRHLMYSKPVYTPLLSGLIAGMLLAVGSIFKQTAVLAVPGILVLALGYYRTWPDRLRAVIAMAVGGCLPWLAVCAYFAAHGALQPMLNDVVFANLGSHYPRDSRATTLFFLRVYADQLPMIWLIAAAFAIIGSVTLFARRRLPQYQTVATYLLAIVGFTPILLHDYPHYWLQPMPWVCLIVAYSFTHLFVVSPHGGRAVLTRQAFMTSSARAFAAGVLVALAIGLTSTESWLTYRLPYYRSTMSDQAALGAWVNTHVPADASMLVGPANPEVYFLTGHMPTVNYVYLLPVNSSMDAIAASQVTARQFDYIVWNTSYGGAGTEWSGIYTAIQRNYHQVSAYAATTEPSQGFVLYVRNA